MSSETCVVTGAGGFIGYHLANALAAAGHRVTGVDRHFREQRTDAAAPRFRAIEADFRDARMMSEALEGASVLFHLAGAHLHVSLREADYWDLNVHSLPALVQCAKAAGVTRVVHTSSVGVYGDIASPPATEATPAHPQSIYGRTKLAGERVILDAGRARGVDIVVLRPAWVYGPGCPRTSRLYRALRRRRFVMIGRGTNLRHPIYVDDMVYAYQLAARASEANGQVLIVADDRPVTTRELVDTFCRVFELPQPLLRIPHLVGAPLAMTVEVLCRAVGVEPPLSRRTLEFFNTSNAFDCARARAVLQFAAQYSLEEGLMATKAHLIRLQGDRGRTCAV